MKTIQKMVMGFMFLALFGNVLNAAPQETAYEPKPDIEDVRLIQQQIKTLLMNKNFELRGTVDVSVVVYLNQENEMVVLNVNTKDEKLRKFFAKNINAQKFADDLDRRGYTYICPMRLRGIS